MSEEFQQELQNQMSSFTESMYSRLDSMIPSQTRMQNSWQQQINDLKSEMDKILKCNNLF